MGVYDTTLPPILKIDSGDTVSFPNTWSHFLNQMQPGVPIETLAKIRVSNPGKGPHSIIGPIYVNGAEAGDVLEVRYKRILPFNWGAVFNNPGSLGTGLLPQDFPDGQVKYLNLDLPKMTAEFAKDIHVPLKPFQGTLGVAPPDGYFPPLSPGVTSSVPPGPHAGNTDLSEMTEGSTMFIPVWKPGALIFTGDSHAVQGDGEITITALETRMRELRIQVVLHKQKNFSWPIAETPTHWIILGLDKDLNIAMSLAARNAINFLAARTSLTKLDAYALCSIAVSFRVTQVVDIVRGVHAMIPSTGVSWRPQRKVLSLRSPAPEVLSPFPHVRRDCNYYPFALRQLSATPAECTPAPLACFRASHQRSLAELAQTELHPKRKPHKALRTSSQFSEPSNSSTLFCVLRFVPCTTLKLETRRSIHLPLSLLEREHQKPRNLRPWIRQRRRRSCRQPKRIARPQRLVA